jgi:ribosomal protein S8E
LAVRSEKLWLLGYDASIIYRLWDPIRRVMRILRDVTFNEAEMAIFINIRSLPEEATTLITFIEIIKIIEKIPNISDTDIADTNDTNIIFENIENALFENIIVEPAPVRKSTRHRKAIFKIMEANIMTANTMEVAKAPIISADEKESEEKNYLSKIIIVKSSIINEDKPTYEEAIAGSKKF